MEAAECLLFFHEVVIQVWHDNIFHDGRSRPLMKDMHACLNDSLLEEYERMYVCMHVCCVSPAVIVFDVLQQRQTFTDPTACAITRLQ